METKTKVAVCPLKADVGGWYKEYGYGKMIKLESGHVTRMNGHLQVIDIREGQIFESLYIPSVRVFLVINQYIVAIWKGYIIVAKIYD